MEVIFLKKINSVAEMEKVWGKLGFGGYAFFNP